MREEISAIIIYYKCGDQILKCMDSLLRQSFPPTEVIIVENSPMEESILEELKKLLRRKNIQLSIINPKKNIGFAKAVNIAIRNSMQSKYVLLLNCDVTLISEDYIEKLVNVLRVHKKCYGASGVLLYGDGGLVWSCGALFDPVTGFNWHLFWKKSINSIPKNRLLVVDYIPFTAALLKKNLLIKFGLLAEDFFVYCEDLDFSLRARVYGYVPVVDTSVKAVHHIEYGKRSSFLIRYYYQYKGNIRVFLKHLPIWNMLTALIFWTIFLTIVEVIYVRVDPVYHILKIRALREELGQLRKLVKKRKRLYRCKHVKSRVKHSISAMLHYVRLKGHSW